MQYTQRHAVPRQPDRREGGFALVVSLLILIVISVIAAAGFVTSRTEVQVSRNHSTSMTAFYVADAALNDYLAVNDTGVVASQGYSYTGGSAVVTANPLVDVDPTATLYLVSAVGSATMPDGSVSQRTVSKLVLFKQGSQPAGLLGEAALSAISGITVSGAAAKADGNDYTVGGCPAAPPITGVRLPTDLFTGKLGNIAFGNPPLDDSFATPLELAQALGIDWAGMKDGTAVEHDYVVTDPSDMPDTADLPMEDWPVTFMDNEGTGEIHLNSGESGAGLLIIGGDVKIAGSFVWHGMILVGGAFVISGSVTIQGTIAAGLNILTGGAPAPTAIGNGSPHMYYHSCYANAALNLLISPAVVAEEPSTWVESF